MDNAWITRLRKASRALGAIGIGLVLVGGIGLALDGGERGEATDGKDGARAGSSAAPGTAGTAQPTPVATTLPVGSRIRSFFVDWAQALRTGDAAFLFTRLHPAVVERYGEPACRGYLGAVRLPQADAQVLGTDAATATWLWETDGRATPVAATLGVRLRRTEDGSTFTESDIHVALVDGDVRWFTDCGTPKEER